MSNEPTLFVGIDPGLSGAVAWVRADGTLARAEPMPTAPHGKGRRIDAAALAAKLSTQRELYGIGLCLLEQVAARPGQGVASMFAFGRAYGAAEAVLQALGVPFDYITPTVWKRAYGLHSDKAESIRKACDLFPVLRELRKGKGPTHDAAEAVLLAELARRRFWMH